MKIIEAMKKVKANKEKIADLQIKIQGVSANLTHETPLYGPGDATKEKINEWLQSIHDSIQENIRLLVSIGQTNLKTMVTITLGTKPVEKTIAEWVWRRREYAKMELETYSKLNDRGLKEGLMQQSTGAPAVEIKIVRHYDPVKRDEKMAEYRSEPHQIDSALEVVNATTDLIEV